LIYNKITFLIINELKALTSYRPIVLKFFQKGVQVQTHIRQKETFLGN